MNTLLSFPGSAPAFATIEPHVDVVDLIAGPWQRGLHQVRVTPLGVERFEAILAPQRYLAFRRVVESARRQLKGRVVWNMSTTTPAAGGTAEMLRSSIACARGVGIDARWVVIPGDEEFFRITTRLYNHLHGSPGDGEALAEAEHAAYEATLQRSTAELGRMVRTGDVVILHNPQTAGLAEAARACGAIVLWRCHVGVAERNERIRAAWHFLERDLANVDAYVFPHRSYAWDILDVRRVAIIEHGIDAFSPKNQELETAAVDAILYASGITTEAPSRAHPVYVCVDGSPRRIDHRARVIEEQPLGPRTPYVLQVGHWNRLKDPLGVLEGFTRGVARGTDAHLLLAGPELDPLGEGIEATSVFAETAAAWRALPVDLRSRVHLVCLPVDDAEENAAMVNALQRRATVVVQKSLAEPAGLAVAEAMWKGRPLVASRVGALQDQVEDGVTGLLVDDPNDLGAFADAVRTLLDDPVRARTIGEAAQRQSRDRWLGPQHVMRWAALIRRTLR